MAGFSGGDGDDPQFCLSCSRWFPYLDFKSHQKSCQKRPALGKQVLNWENYPTCHQLIHRKMFESHQNSCGAPTVGNYANLVEICRRQKIEADLAVLKGRLSKSISVVIIGHRNIGKTTTKTQLQTHKYVVLDPDYPLLNIIKEICLADMVVLVLDANIDLDRTHVIFANIVFSLGFTDITCSFNKMDLVANPKEVYQRLKDNIRRWLLVTTHWVC